MNSETERAKILIVDDIPGNIKTVASAISDQYDVTFATTGAAALEAAATRGIDLILLDVVMPEMDGFEVCQRLKSDDTTSEIPVIFVTAKSEESDETRGFELGGVDYITKPISPPIVRARVATHLELFRARKRLKQQNQQLLETAKLREDVEHITRHDLKSPINGIIGFTEMLLQDETLSEDHRESVMLMKDLGYRTINMVNLSLGMVKMEQGTYPLEPEPMDLLALIKGILIDIKGQLRFKRLDLKMFLGEEPVQQGDSCYALGENLLSYSLFANLLKNAVEASPRNGPLTIRFEQAEMVTVAIHNMGTVPEKIRDTFFEKFATAGKAAGTGLGTYSAKLIAETQHGGITMETGEESGTTITVTLPRVES
ncbi:MAG: hybrid sensor histidine kinase/response regulator [Gammaproteobacteria bacterium]|nr:hybrid sensor histidine kinase/response regulator [Gammaproteobacteria bacterium]